MPVAAPAAKPAEIVGQNAVWRSSACGLSKSSLESQWSPETDRDFDQVQTVSISASVHRRERLASQPWKCDLNRSSQDGLPQAFDRERVSGAGWGALLRFECRAMADLRAVYSSQSSKLLRTIANTYDRRVAKRYGLISRTSSV
jgi:hypothetical protein